MIKYLKHFLIVLFIPIRKILGLVLFYIALPFGKWANNTVFNYVLEHNIYLPKLQERPISKLSHFTFKNEDIFGYRIEPYHKTKEGGYIKYKYVDWVQYQIAKFIWGWLDNDSNYYTTDLGFMEKVVIGKHFAWLPKFAKNQVQKEINKLKAKGQYGNSFDLGDYRKFEFYWLSSTLWLIRNTAYNWKYLLHEIRENDKNNFYVIIKVFGFYLHWGYIPYENKKRKGRLVYGWKYIKYIDDEIKQKAKGF